MWKILCRSRCAAAILAVTAFLTLPARVQTQFSSPVAVITANLGHDGGTTGTINTTGANLLVACVASHGYSTPTLSDSKSNSWTLAASSVLYLDGHVHLYYSVPTAVGSGHTFTVSGQATLASINVTAWAGAAAAPLDQAAGAGVPSGTSVQPGSVTPTQNGELLVTCLTNNGDTSNSSRSINQDFIISGQIGENATVIHSVAVAGAYRVQPTATAANPMWSYSPDNRANAAIATFKTVASGGGDDLASKPLFTESDMTRVGGFKVEPGANSYEAGFGMAYNPANGRLLITDGPTSSVKVMEIAIPVAVDTSNTAQMNTASITQTQVDVTEGTMGEVTGVGNESYFRFGGLLVYNSKLVFNGLMWYDANNDTRVSHGTHSLTLSESSFAGWDTFWNNTKTGYMAGPMAHVPSYAQDALGGTVLTGGAPGASIISRLSLGPAAIVINPDDISGRTPNTHTGVPLLYYTLSNPLEVVNEEDGTTSIHEVWNKTSYMYGMAIPNGYRTLLYFGKHGYGDFCYGAGTDNQALHGTPNGMHEWCYDLEGWDQGDHAYPYRYQVWAYDLLDLEKVKAGTINPATGSPWQPWELQPYAWWQVTFPVSLPANPLCATCTRLTVLGGVGYDSTNKIFYVPQMLADPADYIRYPIIWKFTHP